MRLKRSKPLINESKKDRRVLASECLKMYLYDELAIESIGNSHAQIMSNVFCF